MSTAGIYNAWPSVIHGTKPYLHNQMKSHQTPHYFGGSQVLINLHPEPQHHMSGNGFTLSSSNIPGSGNRRSVIPLEAQNVANNNFNAVKRNMPNIQIPPTTAPSAPYPQPIGTGFFDDFMSGLLGGSINDLHTYRSHSYGRTGSHTTGLRKSIGSNIYRLAKV